MEERRSTQLPGQGFLSMRALCLISAACLLLVSVPALAANLYDASATFSELLDLVRNSANQWSGRLRGFAVWVFWSLATIQIVWTFGPMLMRRAELGEFMSELAMFVVRTALFFSLLTYSVEWGSAIVDSFRHAGAAAAGRSAMLHPGDMFGLAVELGNTVSNVDTWNPATGVGIMFASLIVLLCFTFIAAFMAVTLIESYLVINASMFFMGFGGAQITREYALSMVRYALAVGAKLFVLTLIVGLVMDAAREWQAAYRHDSASTLTLVGLSFLLAYASKTVTELVGSMISGVSPGGGSILGGMAAAGMAFGAAAATTISAKLATSGIMGGASESGGGIANAISSSLSGGGGSNPMGSAMSGMSGGGSPSSGPGMGSMPPRQPSSSASMAPGGSSPASSMRTKAAHAAHVATAGAARTGGLLSSIAVPGMEGVENISIGASPHSMPPASAHSPDSEPVSDTPENVIRPEDEDRA